MLNNKLKIVVTTFSRSEFGLLQNLIKLISNDEDCKLDLFVGGSHLSKKKGFTVKEIRQSGIKKFSKIYYPLDLDDKIYLCKSLGVLIKNISIKLDKIKPDIVICLGDRYELLAVGSVCTLLNIPIAHISGGEISEGAIDDQIRHAMTKLAHLHYVSNKAFQSTILGMGEEKWRTCISGEPGLDNINHLRLYSKIEIEKILNIKINNKIAILTFHPVTHESSNLKKYLFEIIRAIKKLDLFIIITGANSDHGGNEINEAFMSICQTNPKKFMFVDSLGSKLYLSLLKYIDVLVGNSSSAIVEAPSYGVPAVNIGNRQKGRIKGDNVIDSKTICNEIVKNTTKALNLKNKKFVNPYYKKNASKRILKHIKLNLSKKSVETILKKKNYAS